MPVIPDDVLDTMVCDSCYKFLSVGPVKVYNSGQNKCGRCSTDEADDEGEVIPTLVAVDDICKCVNRFDGCRQLLSHAEVADHEATCKSKTYICPVCAEDTEIPTFLLINHFRGKHSECFLETPSFEVSVAAPCSKTHLYRVRDNLFFVQCDVRSVNTISLNAFQLGKQEEVFNQRFTVTFRDEPGKVETSTKTCTAFQSGDSQGFLITRATVESRLVHVEFSLDLVTEEPSSSTLPDSPKEKMFLPRKITLDRDFRTDHPEFWVSSDNNSVIMTVGENHSEFYMGCHNCETISASGYFLEVTPKKYHSVCSMCARYYKKKSRKTMLIPETELYSIALLYHVIYSCIWGCSEFHSFPAIYSHEEGCSQQHAWRCPVPICTRKENLSDLKAHLECEHLPDRFSSSPFVNIFQTPDNSLVHWYVWTDRGFLSIAVSRKGPLYKIRLISPGCCEALCLGLLFDAGRNFLNLVTAEKPCLVSSEPFPSLKRHYLLYVFVRCRKSIARVANTVEPVLCKVLKATNCSMHR